MDVPEYAGLMMDDLLKQIVDRNIFLSIFSPRKLPFLCRMFWSVITTDI
jgi:hypothetical protein